MKNDRFLGQKRPKKADPSPKDHGSLFEGSLPAIGGHPIAPDTPQGFTKAVSSAFCFLFSENSVHCETIITFVFCPQFQVLVFYNLCFLCFWWVGGWIIFFNLQGGGQLWVAAFSSPHMQLSLGGQVFEHHIEQERPRTKRPKRSKIGRGGPSTGGGGPEKIGRSFEYFQVPDGRIA